MKTFLKAIIFLACAAALFVSGCTPSVLSEESAEYNLKNVLRLIKSSSYAVKMSRFGEYNGVEGMLVENFEYYNCGGTVCYVRQDYNAGTAELFSEDLLMYFSVDYGDDFADGDASQLSEELGIYDAWDYIESVYDASAMLESEAWTYSFVNGTVVCEISADIELAGLHFDTFSVSFGVYEEKPNYRDVTLTFKNSDESSSDCKNTYIIEVGDYDFYSSENRCSAIYDCFIVDMSD